jgi:aspartate-semialdehyde dehydrogenase
MKDPLFDPIKINQMEVKNRIYLPAMHLAMCVDFEVTDQIVEFYARRARGGAGLICVGFATIDDMAGNSQNIGAHKDEYLPGLTRLASGIKDFIGGNCTVSLMLMAMGGLFEKNWVEWMTSMTYQSASGAGANTMRELVTQMGLLGDAAKGPLSDPAATILDVDRRITAALGAPDFPIEYFGAPLAASLIPWIDRPMDSGQTREEWKGFVETNKILGRADNPVAIDGQCVRVGAMRCHSQALTIKLTEDIPLDVIETAIASANDWVSVVPNDKAATLQKLSPAAVSGTLTIPVGRIRKLNMGPRYLTAFTVGDQLLWGAAEPLRRALKIILDYAF